MQVTHPQEPFNNIPPEDVFVAVNDLGVQSGYGYVMYQYQPSVYPDKPVNIFFNMDCTPESEYLVFGALVARARQMRQANPGESARLYTSVTPGDSRKMNFFLHNGLTIGNTEDLVRLQIPQEVGPELFNCSIIPLPLNTVQEQANLVERLQRNGLGYISLPYLQLLQANPNFHVWGILYGQNLVGECVISGRDQSAELVGIYIVPEFQRRGLGKRLLHRALAIVGQEGVNDVRARIMSASQPQVHLMRAFNAEMLDQTLLFPGLDL
ncbi:MAG: GNAT family N-acetyltransferase [Clostridia bacterium]|nr:GNAT family N-acetyltransferase [Clostridia bacterium]